MAGDIAARQQRKGFRRVHLAVRPARDELLFAQASRAFQPFAQIPQLLAAMAQKRQGLFPIDARFQFHGVTILQQRRRLLGTAPSARLSRWRKR